MIIFYDDTFTDDNFQRSHGGGCYNPPPILLTVSFKDHIPLLRPLYRQVTPLPQVGPCYKYLNSESWDKETEERKKAQASTETTMLPDEEKQTVDNS